MGLLIASHLDFSEIPLSDTTTFEAIFGKLKAERNTLHILNIYRPPGRAEGFFDEFQEFLSFVITITKDLVIMGDFNVHVDTNSSDSKQFSDILDSFDLSQHVDFPTHIYGHSLDLVISSPGCEVLSASVADRISDHFTVIADLNVDMEESVSSSEKIIHFRNIKKINLATFKDDIRDSELIKNPCQNANALATQYVKILSGLLEKHAPLRTKKVVSKPPNPWMTSEILSAKRQRRYLERVWRKNPTPLNRSRLTRQTHLCNKMMSKAKSRFFSETIENSSSDPRSLWEAFNKLLHRSMPTKLPDCTSIPLLAERFSSFFIDKISIIRSSFSSGENTEALNSLQKSQATILSFAPATKEEVRKLVLASPPKILRPRSHSNISP